ncbi:MAG TPA: DNA-directed RNA polymerase subunit alpha [Verrucomicrobiae bacterium]|nr:DNA-directed RNA polymerase subunit alpha [Verrucomicrobiae bacterium]
MEQINLPITSTILETEHKGSFAVEPLFPGYASTLGNALRRVLLSSLEGSAVDYVEIDGVQHEFSTIPHVKEDVVQIILNLKQLRFKLEGDFAELTLTAKGGKTITGADFGANSDCRVVNPELHIATLDKGADVTMRIGVKHGRGYEAIEKKTEREKTVGKIYIDSIFSPVLSVSYRVENTRVGQMTNFDKLLLDIQTDGSIMPSEALKQSAAILTQQYQSIAGMSDAELAAATPTEQHEQIIVEEDGFMILHNLDPKTKIEDAGLSSRTVHALTAAGYKTLSGLKRLSDIKLESIKGLGAKGVEEVKAVLSRVS